MKEFCEPKQTGMPSFNDSSDYYILILYNDKYNYIDYVIDCLIEICKHEPEQAEQCAYMAHYKGSCKIAEGYYSKIIKMKRALIEKKLNVKVFLED